MNLKLSKYNVVHVFILYEHTLKKKKRSKTSITVHVDYRN